MGLFSKKKDKTDTTGMSDRETSALDPMSGLGEELEIPKPQKAQPAQSGKASAAPGRAGSDGAKTPPARNAKGQVKKLINELEAAGLVDTRKIRDLRRQFNEAEAASSLKPQASSDTQEIGLALESDMLAAIASSINMECIKLDKIHVPPETLAAVDPKVARNYRIFPLESTNDTLTIAVADPLDVRVTDELGLMFNKRIIAKLASEVEIDRAIRNNYEGDQIEGIIQRTIRDAREKQIEDEERDREEFGDDEDDAFTRGGVIDLDKMDGADDAAVVKFVNLLFKEAVHERASDIHVEPTRFSLTIRFRIDGVLHVMPSPPKKWQNMIISRLKVMSGMDLAEKRVPQDGRIQLNIGGKSLDLRVSCLPSIYGESIVMRILDQGSIMLGLEDVGFMPDNVKLFEDLIRSPNGIILMTGPTGSGKTTTLYAALNVLNTPETKIVTLEDPVEYQVQGINQMQVNKEVDLDFSRGLRTVLRQSPDIILVGEIRDEETGTAAIRAALTGHLVFSTLHTNDAPGSTTRLIDMGIKPFLVASALEAAIGQRLVRRICSACRNPYTYKPEEISAIGVDPKDFMDHDFFVGRGCARCGNSGYRGRTAIHEIFRMNAELRQMVIRREATNKIKNVAVKHGMRTLRMDGWEKVVRGHTTIEEILRVTILD